MKYIALLRGVNVGKGRQVSMARAKDLVSSLGFHTVSTYINSGNIIFEGHGKVEGVRKILEEHFTKTFGFVIPIIVKTQDEMTTIARAIPKDWKNDAAMKSDVAYLFPEIDSEKTIDELDIKRAYVHIRYVRGAIFWTVDRKNYTKSQLIKLVGTKVYKFMTMRNVHTARILGSV